MFRLSGVVIRISGGRRSIRRRSSAGRVAAPGQDADLGEIRARLLETGFQLLQGRGEVPPDVVVQGLERRDVEDAGLARRPRRR